MSDQLGMFDGPQPGEYLIPDDEQPGRCRSCDAAIVWTRTPAGKPMSLDLGKVRIVDGKRYALSHFATCPHGREWRKLGRGGNG